MKYQAAILLAVAAHQAQAAIVADGPWTGDDWYDSAAKIGVSNGVVYSNDPITQRRIMAPIPLDEDVRTTYESKANVQRVKRVFTQAQWDQGFAHANALYSYDTFLQAVAKFPAFCNETNVANQSLDDTCKRELAAVFAHWGQETGARTNSLGEFWLQGLFYVEEIAKNDYIQYSGWAAQAYPAQSGQQYYGRGPFQLSWNYNYGMFSNAYYGTYDAKMTLLENPGLVAGDGFLAFTSGLWFYMTPQDPKPSMHDVMTEFWQPNSVDLNNNVKAGFGTTTNILNGGIECGTSNSSSKADDRKEYYKNWLNLFGFDVSQESEQSMRCNTSTNFWAYSGGAGDIYGHFHPDTCRPDNWQTQYSFSARDDYKRCICNKVGTGAAECGLGPLDDLNTDYNAGADPSGGDSSGGDSSGGSGGEPSGGDSSGGSGGDQSVWTTFQTLQEIRDNPHYSQTSYSRTLYQVERELNFIEQKLQELLQVAVDNQLV